MAGSTSETHIVKALTVETEIAELEEAESEGRP